MLGKRIMYPTLNSWNNEYAPAYNMKIYDVIPKKISRQSNVYIL